MKYEIKHHDDPVQAPELGTLGIPRAESMFTGQDRLIAWLAKAEANTKTLILSTDVVTLLLVEGTAKAIDRTWSRFEVLIGSVAERYQPAARGELWNKAREADPTSN
jgi:hypothetical protein